MTHKTEFTQFDMAMKPLINHGFNGMADTIKILLDSAMKINGDDFSKQVLIKDCSASQLYQWHSSQKPSKPE